MLIWDGFGGLAATMPSKSSLSLIKDAKIEAQPPQDQKLKVRIGGNHLLTQDLHIIYSKLLDVEAGCLELYTLRLEIISSGKFGPEHKCCIGLYIS